MAAGEEKNVDPPSREILESVIELFPEPMFLKSVDGRYLLMNRAARGLLEKTPAGGIRGATAEELFSPGTAVVEAEHDRRVLNEGAQSFQERVRVEGRERVYESTRHPVSSSTGETVAILGVARDVTDRSLAEFELERELREKDEFVALLGHELRNPLAPILNHLRILEDDAPGPDAWQRARDVIGRQVRHLRRRIDDLLDVARLEGGVFEFGDEVIDLASVVAQATDDLRPSLQAAGIELRSEIGERGVWVRADDARVSQALAELVDNAERHGRPRRITIRVDSGEGFAEVSVTDDGVGIDGDTLKRLGRFALFSRPVGSAGRGSGGLGLGLALVHRLARRFGGSLAISSGGRGDGTTVVLRLLRAAAPQSAVVPPQSADPTEPHCTVLVVEDNSDAAESLKALLELDGHDVHVAGDGETAVETIEKIEPDVVLCDIGLPGTLDGYDVCRKLRQHPHAARSHIVAMTGLGRPTDRAQALQAGFDEHLTKPVEPEAVERLVGTRAALR